MNMKNQLKQLDDLIRIEFITAITGGINLSDIERRLMSLPPRFGGLRIPVESKQKEYEFSTIQSKDLTTNTINQQPQLNSQPTTMKKKIKSKTKFTKMQHHNEELQKLRFSLSNELKRLNK